ncbi:hypothetical protein MR829_22500 [Paracoccus versutus]|uniref:hypothetical protein n=1 Tax=Paracoccus versutus TaxID=34007 RepID=UPI001FB63F32|nr:hypothetical protein [Paracoccus versutus]MCJ1903106.1 hypothetical protein [Paracoccus versutus]
MKVYLKPISAMIDLSTQKAVLGTSDLFPDATPVDFLAADPQETETRINQIIIDYREKSILMLNGFDLLIVLNAAYKTYRIKFSRDPSVKEINRLFYGSWRDALNIAASVFNQRPRHGDGAYFYKQQYQSACGDWCDLIQRNI